MNIIRKKGRKRKEECRRERKREERGRGREREEQIGTDTVREEESGSDWKRCRGRGRKGNWSLVSEIRQHLLAHKNQRQSRFIQEHLTY